MILNLKKSEKSKDLKYIAYSADKKKFEFVCRHDSSISINKKVADIHLEESDGFTFVVWKKQKFQVDVIERNQNRYQVLINGISYNFSIETPNSYKRKKFLEKNKKESKVEAVTAPMPGKIIEVMVEPNSKITMGEPILILEAMKMQNEILANVTGRVVMVHIKKDDTVMKDDILVEIER